MDKLKSLLFSGTSKDATASMVGNVSIALGGMLFTIILARHLPPAQFGILAAIFALATMLGSVSDLGTSSALVNFLPKFPNDRHAITSITFWFQTAFSLFLSLLILTTIPLRHLFLPGASITEILLLSAVTFLICLETFAFSLQRAQTRFVFNAFTSSIDTWGKLTVVLILSYFNLLSIQTAVIATIISVSLATAISLTQELGQLRPFFPRSQVKQIFHFTKWIGISRLFSTTTNRLDTVLLNAIGSSFQAGIFAAASRLALAFAIIVSSLGAVIAPRFSRFTSIDQVKSYLKKIFLLTLFCVAALILSVFLAPLLINFIFGSAYKEAIIVYQYLGLAMIPFIFTLVTINPLLYYFNQPAFVTFITIIQTLILISLDVLLIPHYGALAPTFSLAIANTFILAVSAQKLFSLLRAKS